METTVMVYIRFRVRAPYIHRIWGKWGSYYDSPKAIFYLLKGDYTRLDNLSYVSP